MLKAKDGNIVGWGNVEKRSKKEKHSALCLGGWGQSIVLATSLSGPGRETRDLVFAKYNAN